MGRFCCFCLHNSHFLYFEKKSTTSVCVITELKCAVSKEKIKRILHLSALERRNGKRIQTYFLNTLINQETEVEA